MRGSEGGKYGIRYLALGGDVMGAPVKLFRSGPGAQRVHPIRRAPYKTMCLS